MSADKYGHEVCPRCGKRRILSVHQCREFEVWLHGSPREDACRFYSGDEPELTQI